MPAGRGEPAAHDDDHALGHRLDLVQHVGADDHRAALGAEPLEQVDQAQALDGIGAVQRFVEHQHQRVLHEGGRHLAALAHALAEAVHAPVRRRLHVHGVERPVDDPAVGDAVQVGHVGAQLAGRQAAGDRFVLGHRGRAARTPSGCRRGDRPSTTTVPWLTGIRPVMARIRVVLPAPFGPSRPVTPAPKEQLSSDSATFWPNHTDTSVATTVASATNAGSSAAGGGGGGGGRAARGRSSLHLVVAPEEDRERDDQHAGEHQQRVQPAVGAAPRAGVRPPPPRGTRGRAPPAGA